MTFTNFVLTDSSGEVSAYGLYRNSVLQLLVIGHVQVPVLSRTRQGCPRDSGSFASSEAAVISFESGLNKRPLMALSFVAIWKCCFSDGLRDRSREILLFTTSGDQVVYDNSVLAGILKPNISKPWQS